MTLTLGALIVIDQQKLEMNHPKQKVLWILANKMALSEILGVYHRITFLKKLGYPIF
jgi:hypothetical protein